MAIICPTVTALTSLEYDQQMARVATLTPRLQIDLMDKGFAHSKSSVSLDDVWWPAHSEADIHLMYQDPFKVLNKMIILKPRMVIVHVETMIHHMHFAAELHKEGIKAGLAILPETPVGNVEQILHSFDHLLIFSGDLGYFGGKANLALAKKAREAKEHHPEIEVGWDGGINVNNIRALAEADIDVLNVGGYIQKSANPSEAYRTLVSVLNDAETGEQHIAS